MCKRWAYSVYRITFGTNRILEPLWPISWYLRTYSVYRITLGFKMKSLKIHTIFTQECFHWKYLFFVAFYNFINVSIRHDYKCLHFIDICYDKHKNLYICFQHQTTQIWVLQDLFGINC